MEHSLIAARNSGDAPEADVCIITSGGSNIPAHSKVLISASTVLENHLNRKTSAKLNSIKVIPILGVPCDAVAAFIRSLYSSRCTEEEMDKYGIHLLALSHLYAVHDLKQRCTRGLGGRLVVENVVDVLQLARLCDAPDLYLRCMRTVSSNFDEVQKTEGWMFLQENDPWLELEILKFLDDTELRKKSRTKSKEERCLYTELSEAMECLEHICTDGCTSVGPYDMDPNQHKQPCENYLTCHGIQMLIKHFAQCKQRVKGGCCMCKRMWQILRLHSATCDHTNSCRVPLCSQFKLKTQLGREGENGRWKLLARKVVSAKVISSLSSPKRK